MSIKKKKSGNFTEISNDCDLTIIILIMRNVAFRNMFDQSIFELAYQAFGSKYDRPLVLTQAFLIETATASNRKIALLSGDRGVLTADEAQIIDALRCVIEEPENARAIIQVMCARKDVDAPLFAARLLAGALKDLGLLPCAHCSFV